MAVNCTTLQPVPSVDDAVRTVNFDRGSLFAIVFSRWSPGFAISSGGPRARQRDRAMTTHKRRLR